MDDDLLPEQWRKDKRELLRTIKLFYWMFAATIVFAWATMPWRRGWSGVFLCLKLTFWLGLSYALPKFLQWMQAQGRARENV